MTLFCELYAMAKTCSLSMLVTADASTGKLTVHVLPKPRLGAHANADTQSSQAETALTQPLCLTATPEEFDLDFVTALRNYRQCHHSLTEQAQATCDLLKAAKDASAKKAAAAVTQAQRSAGKGVSASPPSAAASRRAASPGGTDDCDDEGHGDEGMADSPDEAEGHAAEDAVTGDSPAASPEASQPQLFG